MTIVRGAARPAEGTSASKAWPVAESASVVRRVLVVHNPVAGRNRRRSLMRVLRALRRERVALRLARTAQAGDAARIAASTTTASVDVVVAAGGDGTINEVVNGLAMVPAPQRPALAIVPLGTANVMAIELGLGGNPRSIAAVIARGSIRTLPLGQVNERRFVMMAGAGFDAHVVKHVRLDLKRRAGKLAYVFESLVQGMRYQFPVCDVTVDGEAVPAAMAVVLRGRHYGGPFKVARHADLFRPELTVCLLMRPGWWNMARYSWGLLSGRLDRFKDVIIRPAATVTIAGLAGMPLQADGDLVAELPVRIALAAETVQVIAPL